MNQPPGPPEKALHRSAEIDINASIQTVFNYISSSEKLPEWLKKCGPINGAIKVEVVKGPYSFVGATRTVDFDNGDTLVEELTSYDPVTSYSYSVTHITNSLNKLTRAGYGQWWFTNNNSGTHLKWTYSFVPNNFLAGVVLSIFLSLFYTRFMNHSLKLAKASLERENSE